MEDRLQAWPKWQQRVTIGGAFVLTVLLGFVTMALLGSLRTYPRQLPGFWDYPSGTIGDALLVPTLVAGLLAQVRALPGLRVKAEKSVGLAAGVAGFIGGAAVPLSWYFGSNTKPIWLLPRAHDYLLAGWIHALFLSAATAAIAALTVTAFRRLRAARTSKGITGYGFSVTSMTLVIGAGIGMLALIGRDSVLGGFTFATAMTVIALVVVAALFLGGLAWACGAGLYRLHWRMGAVVCGFVAGLIALIIQWQPPEQAIVGVAAVIAMLGAYATTSELEREPATHPYRLPAALAMASLLIAGLIRAADALVRGEPWPVAWLIGAVALAGVVLRVVAPASMRTGRIAGFSAFLGYCMFVCYLAERALLPHTDASSAGAALSSADMVFDLLVISVVQSRYRDLGEADAASIRAEYLTEQQHRAKPTAFLETDADTTTHDVSPEEIVADMVPMGLAVGLGLLTLLAVAAKPLGLDRGSATPAAIRLIVLGGPLLLVCLLGLSIGVLTRWQSRVGEPQVNERLTHLDLPRWYWLVPATGEMLWLGLSLVLTGGAPRVPLISVATATLMFLLTAKSLIWSTTKVQTLSPTLGQGLLAIGAGVSTAFATFWLISYGMWEHGRPIAGGWLSAAVLVVFLGNVALATLTGWTMSMGIPKARDSGRRLLSRKSVCGYVLLDTAIFNVVLGIGVLIPLYAAVRDSALGVSPLHIVASMVFIPGFFGGVIWGLHNWQAYDNLMQSARRHGVPKVILARCNGCWRDAVALDSTWRQNLHFHIVSQRAGVALLSSLGLLELLRVLLQ